MPTLLHRWCAVVVAFTAFAHAQTGKCQLIDPQEDIGVGDDFFPGNIFELRPPHVRVSNPSETAATPHSYLIFPFFVAPPAIQAQESVLLRETDALTAVYPVTGGAFHSGGATQVDRVSLVANHVIVDVFTIPLDFFGNALVGPAEAGRFLGMFAPGNYVLELRQWYIPREYRDQFDPDHFDPNDFLVPSYESAELGDPLQEITITLAPLSPGIVSVPFTVQAVPEPSSAAMLPGVAAALAAALRSRGIRLPSSHALPLPRQRLRPSRSRGRGPRR